MRMTISAYRKILGLIEEARADSMLAALHARDWIKTLPPETVAITLVTLALNVSDDLQGFDLAEATDKDLRWAHSAHNRGDHSSIVNAGERRYQANRSRTRRASARSFDAPANL